MHTAAAIAVKNGFSLHDRRRKISQLPLIKPPRLELGDRIGIISPAGPVSESDLRAGCEILASSGLRVRPAPHLYDRNGYLAGKDEARLEDLHAMFQDQEIKAIFCARGGYGSLRLLDGIDYDRIKSNPKIMVGFSDITALLMAIYEKTGLVVFHGPMVRDLASGHPDNRQGLLRMLFSDQPVSWDLTECEILAPGKARGPLMGGNLSLVCHLLGTPFMPSLDGCILFLEDRGEAAYRLDRMLTHLTLSGKLKGVSGIIAGQFDENGVEAMQNRLLLDIASDLDIPLVVGFPVGHGKRNLALPMGPSAELDTELMMLTVREACVI